MSIPIAAEPLPLAVDSDGVIRIGETRVTLDTVVFAFAEGATAEAIAEQYPSLDLGDIYAVIGYYLRHRSEVESYLDTRQQQADRVREENESRSNSQGVRSRLLARQREGK